MATITAEVGGGNWTTGATWVGGTAPTAADDALLTLTSGAVTADAGSVCRSLVCTGYVSTLTISNSATALAIGDGSGGALTLSAGMTLTIGGTSSVITFKSTSTNSGAGWGITTAGKVMPGITINGAGGYSKFLSAVNATGGTPLITLTAGTLDFNGQTVTTGRIDSSGALTRTLTPGSSVVTLTSTNAATAWTTSNTTNLTVTANTAAIWLTGAGAGATLGAANYNGLWFVLSASGTQAVLAGSTVGTVTLGGLTRNGTAVKTDALQIGCDLTVANLVFNSNSNINRLLVLSNTVGTARTITAATVVITNVVDFQDITGAGAATWTVAGTGANYLGDCGGNSGITFTTAATQTATGTASFTWSTHGWTSRVPLPQDDVSIPNAFVAGRTVTADMPRLGKSISFAGCTGSPIWDNTVAHAIFGSLTLVAGVTPSGNSQLTLAGRGSFGITSAGRTFTQGFSLNAPGGTYTLQDAFVDSRSGNALDLVNGTLIDNGQSVTLTGVNAAYRQTGGTLTKTGAWSFGTTGAASFVNVTSGTLSDTGSWTLTAASTNTRTFAGGGKTYGTLTYTVAGSTGALTITGDNTFATVNFSDITNARTINFPTATSTTITTLFNVFGTAGKLMTVTGDVDSPVLQSCDYLNVVTSDATGGAWYAGANSTDGGSNTGWIFTAPPTGVTDDFFALL